MTRTSDTETFLNELISATPAEARGLVERGLPGGSARWAEALRNQAGKYYHTDAARARALAERALLVAKSAGDATALGWGHRACAEALLFSGRLLDAEAEYGEAAAAFRRAREHGLLGQVLVGRAPVLSMLGRHREAATAVAEARRNLERARDDAYLAKLAMNMGNIHFQRDEYQGALREYEEAARLFAKLGVRDETVLGLEVNRAVVLTQLDRLEEALDLFQRLEAECAQRGFDLLLAQVRMNAAYVHSLCADYQLALSALARATAYFRETEHPAFLATCYLNRAEIYQQLNVHDEALDLASRAAPLFVSAGLRYDEGLTRAQAAMSRLALEDWAGAAPAVLRARSLFRAEKNASRSALMELLHAHVLLGQGRRAAARRKLDANRARFRELGLVRWEAAAAVLLARTRPAVGSGPTPHGAIEDLRDLLGRVPGKVYPLQSYEILSTLGELEEKRGATAQAERCYRAAAARVEDMRVRIPTEDSKISFLRGKTDLFDRLIAIELQKSKPQIGKLFALMERARAQSLLDRIRDPGAYLDSVESGALRASDRTGAMRRRIAWLHAKLSRYEIGSEAEREVVPVLRRRLQEAEADWTRALREREEAKESHAESGRVAPRAQASDVSAVERLLAEDHVFLSYHLGRDFALAVVIARAGSALIPLAADLSDRVRALADRLDFQWGAAALHAARSGGGKQAAASPSFRMLQNTTEGILRELHGLLWAPVERAGIAARRWSISPHGAVHRIPLHALLGADGFLAEKHVFTIQPSARVWMESRGRGADRDRSRRAKGARRAWIGGVPSEGLPEVRREVGLVAARLDGWTVRTDLAPGRQALLDAAGGSDLVHLAAHGSLRRDNPSFSYLELTDGPLFVHDLRDLRMGGSTVVLTACSSGRGEAPTGDEWIGLARGFVRAGAGAIVASLWPIQDEPTVELIDSFYSRYADGSPPAEALAHAMRTLLRDRPHPWQWGSFAVLGGI